MARKRQVTRTIKTTVATIKAVDLEKEEMLTMSLTLPQTYKDNDAVLKKAKSMVTNPNMEVVKVIDTVVVEHLYGMPEEEFINLAHIIDTNEESAE